MKDNEIIVDELTLARINHNRTSSKLFAFKDKIANAPTLVEYLKLIREAARAVEEYNETERALMKASLESPPLDPG